MYLFVIASILLFFVALRIQIRARVKPFIIRSPRLAILNLKGSPAEQTIHTDRAAIGPLFAAVDESICEVPKCDVLLLYCDFGTDGEVMGSPLGLDGIVRNSGAKIVLVGSQNPANSCTQATKRAGRVPANLVVTLDRKSDAFPIFYRRIFEEMAKGVSMPVAWNKLAPQIPRSEHVNCPECIMVLGAGQIAFARNA